MPQKRPTGRQYGGSKQDLDDVADDERAYPCPEGHGWRHEEQKPGPATGFTGNVTVTAPTVSGIKPKPADPVTTTNNSATFKMKIGAGVAPGSYPLTFTAQDGSGKTRSATVTLIVQ